VGEGAGVIDIETGNGALTLHDADDPRLAPYRNLKDAQSLRGGHFIAEGRFILETLLTRSRFRAASILIREDRRGPLAHLLMVATAQGVPVYAVDSALLETVAGYDIHRGVLAAVRTAPDPCLAGSPDTALDHAPGLAVLCNIANPDNVGAIFRNAAALGLGGVLLDGQTCPPLYRKAVRVSMGAVLTLPWRQNAGPAEILADELAKAGRTLFALTPSSDALPIEAADLPDNAAFLFGEEAHGLPERVQIKCTPLSIPMAGGNDSLNVAAASAIVFDHWRRRAAARHTG
jgi:tRNA G18 (ribose-2'-O)-methylase SpoU